jgi:four helix bundle protein
MEQVAGHKGYTYRNLGLWQKAQEFAVEVVRLVDGLPARRSAELMGHQLARAATSVAANIAEGHGRFSISAYRNHLLIARGSATEADSWLDLLLRLGYVHESRVTALHARCDELIAALTRRIRDLTKQAGPTRIHEEVAEYELLSEGAP